MVTTNPAALPADWRDILALTKPRVMSLVVFSGLCGMLAAPSLPPLALGFTAILCIALGAGACGALNQWYEADIDAKMRRTAKRPLPAGRMDRQSALHFGVGLGAFSVILMGLAANWLAAALLAVSILFYVLIYTVWLKPRTPPSVRYRAPGTQRQQSSTQRRARPRQAHGDRNPSSNPPEYC